MTPPERPYPPSWVDRLIDRIDALPGPAWVAYLVMMLAIIIVTHVAAWVDGVLPVGDFDSFLASLGIYVALGLAAIAWIDGAAGRAWESFRGALSVSAEESSGTAYALTTMPARPALAWSAVGVIAALAYVGTLYGTTLSIGVTFSLAVAPATIIVASIFSLIAFAGSAVFTYHSIRQFRLIDRLHASVEQVDLLALEPLHAFSGVTARTGVVLLSLIYVSVLTDPATFTNPALIVLMPIFFALAIACFVVPLWGMHGRIVAEKSRRLAAVNRRLDAALRDLDRRADAADLTDADAVNKHLASLLAQREVIAKTPTWPWAPETLRGFSTAILLPIGLWLVFRVLERFLA